MSSKPLKIAIVVLAAGESKRMGKPKQNLVWKNTTLLGNTIETALDVQSKDVFVVLGAHYQSVFNFHKHYPVQFLNNKNWRNDLGSSISFATLQIRGNGFDGILFILADQPQVTAVYLKQLINKFEIGKSQIIAIKYEKINGIPVLFDACYFDELIANTNEGAKSVIKQHGASTLSVQPDMYFEDIDTMGDYENAVGLTP